MKRISTIWALLWVSMSSICAQKNAPQVAQLTPTASLEKAFHAAASDKERVAILLNENYEKYLGQTDQALVLYQKGLQIAQQMGDNKKTVQLMLDIANFYQAGKLNEYEAFEWYQKALNVAEKAAYHETCASVCNSIGFVYYHQGFRDKMYEYQLKSIDFAEKTDFPHPHYFITLLYHYTSDNRIDEAYAVGEKLTRLEKKGYFKAKDKLQFYGYFLRVLKKMPDKTQAVKVYTHKIQAMIDTIDLGNNVADIDNVAFFCLDVNRPDMTIKLATKLLTLKTNRKTQEFKADGHKYLAEAYEMLGNYPLSIKHYKEYAEARVGFMTTALKNQSREKVLMVESEKALLVKQNEVDKQRWLAISGFCIAVVMLLGILVVYYFYKREQKTKQELAKLNAAKDKLFALISHDLMSPLANFKALLMLPAWGLISQAEFETLVKDLSIKAHNLYSTCENMLHWAITQMEGMKTKVEIINVAAVINEQISLLEPIAKGKQIEIQQFIPDDITLEVDKNHFVLIIRNLLQNALKFTHTQGAVVFKAENDSFGKGGKRLMIQDNGIGMSSEIMSQLFQIDKNTNRAGTSKEQGTGLGLILTKELVELNRGQIDVTSTVGRGTAFTLAF
ncbi:tetratricopeptide repeat-containing sensor histidine kinase [Runella sp.]|uniref:tetratricopeptide repeat-containing sensor histidine kinase n=1 Tax=Runella sp. TaxID=1960881 RepID=UPI003D0C3CEE